MWRRFLRSFNPESSNPSNSSDPATSSTPSFPLPTAARSIPPTRGKKMSNIYKPTVQDVLLVKSILAYQPRSSPLPIELIDQIIDDAEYWPHVHASLTEPVTASGGYDANHDILLLRTPPICSAATTFPDQPSTTLPEPELIHPVRKIVFTLNSHDQGWSGEPQETHGTYHPTYTWFSAGLERADPKEQADVDELHFSPEGLLGAWHDSDTRKQEDTVSIGSDSATMGSDPDSDVTENEDEEGRDPEQKGEVLKTPVPQWKFGKAPLPPDDSDDPIPSTSSQPEEPSSEEPRIKFEVLTAPYIDEVTSHWASPLRLQSNVQSQRNATEHTVVWRSTDDVDPDSIEGNDLEKLGRGRQTENGQFVRNMRRGDVVTLRAHARFPGWRNDVESAEVDVYFVV